MMLLVRSSDHPSCAKVIVASADNLTAPFRFEKELWGVFSHVRTSTRCLAVPPHPPQTITGTAVRSSLVLSSAQEPAAIRAPTGEYVVFFTTTTLGCGGYGPCVPRSICPGMGNGSTCNPGGPCCWTGCRGGGTSRPCVADRADASPLARYPTYMAYASNPLGPFSTPVMVYNGTDGDRGAGGGGGDAPATGDTNFAGVILPDGSLVGLWKGDVKGGRTWSLASYILGVSAADWRRPSTYRWGSAVKGNTVFPQLVGNGTRACEIEDPTLWYDTATGVVHALVHNWAGGGHAASADRGETWRWYGGNCSAAAGPSSLDWSRSAWPPSFHFTSGDALEQTPRRRERPHLLVTEDGVVSALTTGVQLGKTDATWTLVQETDSVP